MPLTPQQRNELEIYQRFHETPPTFWQLWELSSKSHAILFMVVAMGSVYLFLSDSPTVALFLVGWGFGALFRDLARFRAVVKVWPILSKVLDWHKVGDLLDGRTNLD